MQQFKFKYVDFLREENMREGFAELLRKGLADLGEVVFCDDPDYVLCSCFGKEVTHYDCTRILLLGENIRPDFNLYDYAIGSDWITYEDRYLHFQWYNFPHWNEVAKLALIKHTLPDEVYKSKEKFCNFVVSNYGANPIREAMFEELGSYKRVESGGRSRNNQPDGQPIEDKLAFQKACRFSLAFENAQTIGYCTEKILDAFAAATVPIYWGDPAVDRIYNPDAFINCNEFLTVHGMAQKVRSVEENPERWLWMMRQPAFKDEAAARRDIYGNPFGDYIRQIVLQGPQKSRRRSPDHWSGRYEQTARQAARLERSFWWPGYAKVERNLVKRGWMRR